MKAAYSAIVADGVNWAICRRQSRRVVPIFVVLDTVIILNSLDTYMVAHDGITPKAFAHPCTKTSSSILYTI